MGKIFQSDFSGSFFEPLLELSDCPKELYFFGSILKRDTVRVVTIVGSRNPSPYARQALEQIIRELRGYPVCIVSGLSLGIDALAHKHALQHDIPTMALPGSGLDGSVLYPASNRILAKEIIENNGCIVSEFEPNTKAAPWTFPKRNRLMARLADLVLVIEAGEKSGTLITARNASEYSVDVGVVPGSIFNEGARGSNELLKHGAQIITKAEDILDLLSITKINSTTNDYQDVSQDELTVLQYLVGPMSRDELSEATGFGAPTLSTVISLLEIKGYVREQLGQIYKC